MTPLKPIKPRKALVVALGLLGGLVFGVLVAVLVVKPTGLLGKRISEKV